MPRSYTPLSPDDAALQLAGKAYGVTFSFWKKFFNFLADGPTLTTIANPSYLSDKDCELREDYQNFLSIDLQLHDILSRKPADEAARLLTLGRDSFRNSQVHAISTTIVLWPTGYKIPPQKSLRGFNDDVCSRLICPPSFDWNDISIHERLQNHDIVLEADNFPSFLWEGESADPQDLNRGFLRGEILVRTMLSILLGPGVAQTGEGSGAGGYADLFNMRTITVPAIAFGAAVARHALTTDTKFTWTTNKGRFSHLCFYHEIITTVSGWSQMEKKQLVEWWNGCVLSNVLYEPALSHSRFSPTFNLNILRALRSHSSFPPSAAESCRGSEGVLVQHPYRTAPGPTPPPHLCANNRTMLELVNMGHLTFTPMPIS